MQTIAFIAMLVSLIKATIHNITWELNRSLFTVPRSLNDYAVISKQTKKTVQRIAQKLNDHPNKIATTQQVDKSKTIRVIQDAEINFFWVCVHEVEDQGKRISMLYN